MELLKINTKSSFSSHKNTPNKDNLKPSLFYENTFNQNDHNDQNNKYRNDSNKELTYKPIIVDDNKIILNNNINSNKINYSTNNNNKNNSNINKLSGKTSPKKEIKEKQEIKLEKTNKKTKQFIKEFINPNDKSEILGILSDLNPKKFKPYSYQDYLENKKVEVDLKSSLGSDIGSEIWKEHKNKIEHYKKYALQIESDNMVLLPKIKRKFLSNSIDNSQNMLKNSKSEGKFNIAHDYCDKIVLPKKLEPRRYGFEMPYYNENYKRDETIVLRKDQNGAYVNVINGNSGTGNNGNSPIKLSSLNHNNNLLSMSSNFQSSIPQNNKNNMNNMNQLSVDIDQLFKNREYFNIEVNQIKKFVSRQKEPIL